MKAQKSFLIVGGIGTIFFGFALFVTPNFEAYTDTKEYGPFDATLIDGDTLSDGVNRYRLVGIDACEMGQPINFANEKDTLNCGYYALRFLELFIGDHQVVCYDQGYESYNRIVARCFRYTHKERRSIQDDIGAFALRSGWAISTNHAEGLYAFRYFYEELIAKVSLRGAWNGQTMTPAEWRQHTQK